MTTEPKALAERLAGLHPAFEDRVRIAQRLGLQGAQVAGDPATSWTLLVRQAEEEGKLDQLETFAKQPPKRRRADWMMGAMFAGGTLIGAALAGSLGLMWVVQDVPHHQDTPSEVTMSMPQEPGPEPDPSPIEPPSTPEPSPEIEPPVEVPQNPPEPPPTEEPPQPIEPVPAPEPAPTPVEPPPAPQPPPSQIGAPSSCKDEDGDGVIGWIYAGPSAVKPAIEAGAWKPPSDTFVRIEHPSAENNWNSKSRAVCTVRAGIAVPVAKEPVQMRSGSWYVPMGPGP